MLDTKDALKDKAKPPLVDGQIPGQKQVHQMNDEDIHQMPEKFLSSKTGKGVAVTPAEGARKKILLIVVLLMFFLSVLISGSIIYLKQNTNNATEPPPTTIPKSEEVVKEEEEEIVEEEPKGYTN